MMAEGITRKQLKNDLKQLKSHVLGNAYLEILDLRISYRGKGSR